MLANTINNNEVNLVSLLKVPSVKNIERMNIVICGMPKENESLRQILTPIGINVSYVKNINNLIYHVNLSTVAVIYVTFDENFHKIIDRLKKVQHIIPYKDTPIFIRTNTQFSSHQLKQLYNLNIDDIIKNSEIYNNLVNFIYEHTHTKKSLQGLTNLDRKISKSVTVRLKLFCKFSKLRVNVQNGNALIKGKISSFQQKRTAKKVALETPGIKKCSTEEILMPKGRMIDFEIESSIRNELDQQVSNSRAFSIFVEDNEATLAGYCDCVNTKQKIIRILENIKDIKCIKDLASIKESKAKELHLKSIKLEQNIKRFFIHSPIFISLLKDSIVISGSIDMEGKYKLIEEIIKNNNPNIHSIINRTYLKDNNIK